MADSCLASLPVHFVSNKSTHRLLSLRPEAICLPRLSLFSSSLTSPSLLSLGNEKIPLFVPNVVRTSGWIGEQSTGWKDKGKFASQDGEEIPEGAVFAEGQSVGGDWEESYPELPEDAKLFVGNLPYDIDSEKLALLFQKAGTVEVAEVIYKRETDQSRGFGFVTMSTVEEAEQAVEIFHRYDWNGRLLTVNKAAARGSRPESPPREFESSFKIYVGNLPWQVDNAGLEQVFSEHGKVLSARVVYDRETGRSRGFGFVTVATKTELDDAIAALDGQSLDGRAIRVNAAEERPRRGSF